MSVFLHEEDKIIKSDGRGYYDYLPGLFIYKDINFAYYDTLEIKNCDKGENFGLMREFKGEKVSKYPLGSALLWTPFFTASHIVAKLSDKYKADGYSHPYQRGIFYASFFYLFLGLFFLRKLLLFYDVSLIRIFLVQCFIVFGTPIIHYTYYDAAFSHVNSFFAITLFLYLVKHYINHPRLKTLFVAGVILGLIVLIRQVNILVVFAIPFLVGDFNRLKILIQEHFYHRLYKLLLFVIGFMIVVFLQMLFHKIQSGYFMVYSYGEEGFNFFEPKFFESWFGFKKGLFIYTPIVFLGILGLLIFAFKNKKWSLIVTYLLFLILVNYVFSSWWSTSFGYSYGLRPWVDFLSLFAIGLILMFNTKYFKFLGIPLGVFFCYVNIIQAYQYRNYILPWGEIGYDNYKKVFLKTHPKYQGYFFRGESDLKDYDLVKSCAYNNTIEVKEQSETSAIFIKDSIANYDSVKLARVWLPVTPADDYKVVLSIKSDKNEVVYYHSQWYFHNFKENKDKVYLNYFFYDEIFIGKQPLFIDVRIETTENSVKINRLQLDFFKLKND